MLTNLQKHQIKNINLFISLNFYFIIIWHILACIWIMVGRLDDAEGNVGWVTKELKSYYDEDGKELVPKEHQNGAVFASAFYFLVTTSTSVGYGDYFGTTLYERIFCILVQFVGICIFSMMQD